MSLVWDDPTLILATTERDFVKLLLMIFLLRKNKNFQILNIFFYFCPPNLVTDQDIKNPLWQSWELFVVQPLWKYYASTPNHHWDTAFPVFKDRQILHFE